MGLSAALDAVPFIGLAVTFVHTGYNASIEFEDGVWSPHVFGTSASEAVEKALRLAPVVEVAPLVPAPIAPPSTGDAPAPICPPPY